MTVPRPLKKVAASIGLCFLFFLPPAHADETTIKVNAAKNLGEVPRIFSSSIWIQNLKNAGNGYMLDKLFRENDPATIHLALQVLQGSKSLDDFKARMENFLRSDVAVPFIRNVVKHNTLLIVGFDPCPMPGWLSANPGILSPATNEGWGVESCSPPRDMNLWGEVVKAALRAFMSKGVRNLGFFVGHEPNNIYLGSEKSLYSYYGAAARAANSVDKMIKVGGIGSYALMAPKAACDTPKLYPPDVRNLCGRQGGWADPDREPLTKNFLEYAGRNDIPVDFVNWHSFGVNPYDLRKQAGLVRKWIRESHPGSDVLLFPSDWSFWNGAYPLDGLDSPESAAYTIASLYNMWLGGYGMHGHDFDVTDPGREAGARTRRNNSTFIGDWSLFTWGGKIGGGVIKPTYNAFKMLSMLANSGSRKNLLIETDNPGINSIAALSAASPDRKTVSTIVSRYVPTANDRMMDYLLGMMDEEGYPIEEDKKTATKYINESQRPGLKPRDLIERSRNRIVASTSDPEKRERLDLLADIYLCSTEKDFGNCLGRKNRRMIYPGNAKIMELAVSALRSGNKVQDVKLTFVNLPRDTDAVFTVYRIDDKNSNACSANKRTEGARSDAPCGVGGVVDKAVWESARESRKQGYKAAEERMAGLGYRNEEIEWFRSGIERCIQNRKNLKTCVTELINRASLGDDRRKQKMSNDLGEAFEAYRDASDADYYRSIDNINNRKDISLEGSAITRNIHISGGKFVFDLPLEPNSTVLITLSMGR